MRCCSSHCCFSSTPQGCPGVPLGYCCVIMACRCVIKVNRWHLIGFENTNKPGLLSSSCCRRRGRLCTAFGKLMSTLHTVILFLFTSHCQHQRILRVACWAFSPRDKSFPRLSHIHLCGYQV